MSWGYDDLVAKVSGASVLSFQVFLRKAFEGDLFEKTLARRVLVAWIHRASELTGTRGQTVHPQCRARGDEACVFEGWWE